MRVRGYTPADRSACLAVFESNVPRFFVPPERAEFAAFLDGPLPGPYLVVEDDAGVVVGCGGYAVNPGTGVADLCWGMVASDRHGTGLGRLLLDARLERARAGAVDEIALHTSQHTRGFYERRGFRTERVVPDGYAPGLDRCDMRLRLRERVAGDGTPRSGR